MSQNYSKPGHLIRRAHQISNAFFTEECGRYDLTSVQYAALTAIRENPGIDATRLCAIIAFDRSTIGDVLERIEAKGWIRRTPSEADRRARILHLTDSGRALLEEVEPLVLRVQERLLEPFSRKERTVVLGLLGRLARMGEA